jgi:transcriptional regulator with XRE-family HTH domain
MKLRLIRTERGVLVADLAKACGLSSQAISALESGKAKEPKNLRTLSCIAEHLGVHIADLCDDVPLAWKGPPPLREEDSEDAAIYMSLGRRLGLVREGLDLSVQQFAARYGFDEAQWKSVEDGALRPNVSILKRLCLDNDITLDFLVFGILRKDPPALMLKIRKAHPELAEEDPTGALDGAGGGSSRTKAGQPFLISQQERIVGLIYSCVIGASPLLPALC